MQNSLNRNKIFAFLLLRYNKKKAALMLMALMILLVTACGKMDASISSGQDAEKGGVKIKIAGTVVSSEQPDKGLAGIQASVMQVLKDEDDQAVLGTTVTTNAGGAFAMDGFAQIFPEKYQYYLLVRDPKGDFNDNDANIVYALTTSELNFNSIRLVPARPRSKTKVMGVIKDARSGELKNDISVSLRKNSVTDNALTIKSSNGACGKYIDESDPTKGREQVDGCVIFNNVWVDSYVLDIKDLREDATNKYIDESQQLVLENSSENNLNAIYIMEESDREDLSVILTWKYSSRPNFKHFDLEANFSIAKNDFDFNHLMDEQIEITDGDVAINPGSGFGTGTGYWPSFLGGLDSQRTGVGSITSNKEDFYSATNDAAAVNIRLAQKSDGRNDLDANTGVLKPEVLTFYQRNPMSAYPKNLGYYYQQKDSDGKQSKRFPIGIGAYTIRLFTPDKTWSDNIYESEAQVKAYQGKKYLGSFKISDLQVPPGEGSKKYWTPFVVEYGFTNTSPTEESEVYFRLNPLAAFNRRIAQHRWATQEKLVDLEGNQIPAVKGIAGVKDPINQVLYLGIAKTADSHSVVQYDGEKWQENPYLKNNKINIVPETFGLFQGGVVVAGDNKTRAKFDLINLSKKSQLKCDTEAKKIRGLAQMDSQLMVMVEQDPLARYFRDTKGDFRKDPRCTNEPTEEVKDPLSGWNEDFKNVTSLSSFGFKSAKFYLVSTLDSIFLKRTTYASEEEAVWHHWDSSTNDAGVDLGDDIILKSTAPKKIQVLANMGRNLFAGTKDNGLYFYLYEKDIDFASLSGGFNDLGNFSSCFDQFDQQSCENAKCFWSVDESICYEPDFLADPDSTEYASCGNYFDESACFDAVGCMWDYEYFYCFESAIPDSTDSGDSGSGCVDQYDENSCWSISGCSWNYDFSYCQDEGAEDPTGGASCSELYNQFDCENAGCAWDDAAFICNDFNTGAGTGDVNCADYDNDQATCENNACSYDTATGYCDPAPALKINKKIVASPVVIQSCGLIDNHRDCASGRCNWDFVTQSCYDIAINRIFRHVMPSLVETRSTMTRACMDYYTEDDCYTEAICQWDASVQVCTESGTSSDPVEDTSVTGEGCVYSDASSCESAACFWDYDSEMCFDSDPMGSDPATTDTVEGCGYTDSSSCESAGCFWDYDSEMCFDSDPMADTTDSATANCVDNPEPASCSAAGCIWTDDAGCQNMAEGCTYFGDERRCMENGCVWDPPSFSCVYSDETMAACSDFPDPDICIGSGCNWNDIDAKCEDFNDFDTGFDNIDYSKGFADYQVDKWNRIDTSPMDGKNYLAINTMISVGNSVFIGTDKGVYEMFIMNKGKEEPSDSTSQGATDAPEDETKVSLNFIIEKLNFPAVKVNQLVEYKGAIYALTDVGVLVIR